MTEQDHSPKPQKIDQVSTAAGQIAAWKLGENLEKGRPIRFGGGQPFVISRVGKALPENIQSADEITSAFQSTFPDKPVISIPEEDPSEIIVEYEGTQDHPNYSRVYAAVNEKGSAPHWNGVLEEYLVIKGELDVLIKDGENPVEKHTLREADEIRIEPGVFHAARASEGWTVFEASSFPGWTPESHHLASPEVAKEFTPLKPSVEQSS